MILGDDYSSGTGGDGGGGDDGGDGAMVRPIVLDHQVCMSRPCTTEKAEMRPIS